MPGYRSLVTFFVSFLFFQVIATQKCESRGPKMPCGGAGSDVSRTTCLKNTMCCYDPTSNPKCFIKTGQDLSRALQKAKSKLGKPPTQSINRQTLTNVASKLNVTTLPSEGRFGTFGTAALAFGFPKCPLKVPFCMRLPCQPFNPQSENDPSQCYSDPRCCFDADLFIYKQIFGQSFMGNAPVCFLGATSLRFVDISSTIQPWNPFYLQPVVDLFEKFVDLNLDLNLARVCFTSTIFSFNYFVTPKCGWQGITKLECYLKGCCFDQRRNHCYYPRKLFPNTQSSYFGNLFRPSSSSLQPTYSFEDKLQYPELFQTKTKTCSKYGLGDDPIEVFQRLPCSQSSPRIGSNGLLDLFRSCPSACCKNYMALVPGLQDLSRTGSPSNRALIQSQLASYTGNSLSSGFISSFFCPYTYYQLPGLADISESIGDCCQQRACYHKALGSSDSSQGWGQWGPFSDCIGQCGSLGTRTRTRTCLSGFCVGPETETVNCTPECSSCQWSNWSPSGACSVTCYKSGNYGSQRYTRRCENNVVGISCYGRCPGSSTKTARCSGLPTCSVTVTKWSSWSRCERDCVQTRVKICTSYGRPLPQSQCPGPRESKSCDFGNCNNQPQWVSWSSWYPWSTCYFRGQSKTRYRRCLYRGNLNTPIGDDICTYVYNNNPTEKSTCRIIY